MIEFSLFFLLKLFFGLSLVESDVDFEKVESTIEFTIDPDDNITVENQLIEYVAPKPDSFVHEDRCKENDASACYALGEIYFYDDILKSNSNFAKACELGYLLGCYELGVYYENNQKTKDDILKSKLYYKQACDKNHAPSCYSLAKVYEDNDDQNDLSFENIISLYKKACSDEYHKACERLGDIYNDDKNNKNSKEKSVEYYKESCSLDNENSCTKLGEIYLNDNLLELAKEYYTLGCSEYNYDGCMKAGFAFKKKSEQGLENLIRAANFFKQVCDYGSYDGCVELDTILDLY